MAVTLGSVPTSNGCATRISFLSNRVIVASLDSEDAENLNITFDSIMLVNPPHLPVALRQQPQANIIVNPGNIGIVESVAGGVDFCYFPSHGV